MLYDAGVDVWEGDGLGHLAPPAGQPTIEGAAPGELAGTDVRFLTPRVAAEAAVIKKARKAVGPNKALATRVVGAWPHGHPFATPVALRVPLARNAPPGALTVFLKEDDSPWAWAPLPAGQVAER